MAVLRADLDTWLGYPNCVVGADDYFDVVDDGIVVLLRVDVPESSRARVEEAVRSCPVSALRIEDE